MLGIFSQAEDHQLELCMVFHPRTMVLSDDGGKQLWKEAAVISFVCNASAHPKAFAADVSAQAVLKASNVGEDKSVVDAANTKAFAEALHGRKDGHEAFVCNSACLNCTRAIAIFWKVSIPRHSRGLYGATNFFTACACVLHTRNFTLLEAARLVLIRCK